MLERRDREPAASAMAMVAPPAFHMSHSGDRKRILRVWQTARLGALGKQVQFMRFGHERLRPLVWLHSVEYPMAPPWGYCVDAAEKGFGIVSVRRPGFGESSAVADMNEEVAVLSAFFQDRGIENAVLIAEGTSRPAGLKLARTTGRIAFALLARPAYAAETFGDVEPLFQKIILQAMQTQSGARLSLAAVKHLVRLSGYARLYESFLKGRSDTEFVRGHERDFAEAWACLSAISAATLQREVIALAPDPDLPPGALAGFPGLAVIGDETPEAWRRGFEAKSASLGIETAILPKGSLFAMYQNPGAVLELLRQMA